MFSLKNGTHFSESARVCKFMSTVYTMLYKQAVLMPAVLSKKAYMIQPVLIYPRFTAGRHTLSEQPTFL